MTQLVPTSEYKKMEELLSDPKSWNEIEAFIVKTAGDFADEVYQLRKDPVDLEYAVYRKAWEMADHLAGPLDLVNNDEGESSYNFTEEFVYSLKSWAALCLHIIEKKERAFHI